MAKEITPITVDQLSFDPRSLSDITLDELAYLISQPQRTQKPQTMVTTSWFDSYPKLPRAFVGGGEAVKDWLPKMFSALVLSENAYRQSRGKENASDVVATLRAYGVEQPEVYTTFPFPDPAVELIAVAVIEKKLAHHKADLDPELTLSILGSLGEGIEKIPRAILRRSKLVFAHTTSGHDDMLPAFARVTSEVGAVVGMGFTVKTISNVVFVATAPDSVGKSAARAFRQRNIIDGESS